ncbi:MAG: hypothetical protein JWN72_2873 [Thermoleophilia bacterium]|nr:hypothetical protein [Thermoleophilia bacterium]
MQVVNGPIQKAFPAWSAASTLTGVHGVAAYRSVLEAAHATTPSDRLDAGIRAYTSFDHALDNARTLPITWAIPQIDRYLTGYDVARQIMLQLANSDLVPGAREHVGSQTMHAGRGSFANAIEVARADGSRYGAHVASGWLAAAAEDAANGAALLRTSSGLGTQLLAGIQQLRVAVAKRQPLDQRLVTTVGDLFAQADAQLAAQVAAATQAVTTRDIPAEQAAMRSTGALLDGWLAGA